MTTMHARARLVFMGRLQLESFVAFARHRAARLGLLIGFGEASDCAITVDISGAAELIDAFEMACSLGPHDCLVLDVARDGLVANGLVLGKNLSSNLSKGLGDGASRSLT
jgi:hypothetical protein